MPDFGVDETSSHEDFSTVLTRRAEPMFQAMLRPASVLLLVGEPGSGKSYMAEYVARLLEKKDPQGVRPFILPHLENAQNDPKAIFDSQFPQLFMHESDPMAELSETFRAAKLADELLELARQMGQGAEPLLVLPGVDRYSPRAIAVLKHLISQQGLRIIGTTHRMSGGANHMGRDPRVKRVAVGPLDLAEAEALFASMLVNTRIAPPTLRRWHAMTGGNSHALTMMLIENERSGALKHGHGVARVAPGEDSIPSEFVDYVDATCSEAEVRTLEMLAFAEPMVEPSMLRLIDPAAARNLMDRNLIEARPFTDSRSALSISRPILAAALRARMSPVQRIDLAHAFFTAVTESMPEDMLLRNPSILVRAVEFGLDCDAPLPHDWLVTAKSRLLVDSDPKLMLRVSLALARGYDTEHAAAAALRAVSFAVQLGDEAAASMARTRVDELVANTEVFQSLPRMLQARMKLTQIDQLFWLGAPLCEVHGRLEEFENGLEPTDTLSNEAVRILRFLIALREGDFIESARLLPERRASEELVLEWVRAPAVSASALVYMQQGHLEEAIRIAGQARSISLVGRRPLNDTVELQSFYWFLGFWACGSSEGAREALREIESEAEKSKRTAARLLDLTEVGWALVALLEARWRDAADLVELISESAAPNDPYGLTPLLDAMLALALAALGEVDGAADRLRRARQPSRGISQALTGFRLRIALQAQQWLRLGDPAAQALELADWSRQQDLGLIELQALHIAAVESPVLARRVRDRAAELAEAIDPLIAEALFSHIEKIAEGATPTDASETEVLLLADLGMWIPLPKSPGLSSREREIALAASFGYSSKFIAERYHLSTRTVETHLAHVYAKLGITDRAELRQWFSADRRVGDAQLMRSST